MSQRGLTLLETMVALVILGLVVVAYLEVYGGAASASRNTTDWTLAVSYAEEGMERAKLDLEAAVARGEESLDGAFERRVHSRPWQPGISLVTVTVTFPDGREFVLERLTEEHP